MPTKLTEQILRQCLGLDCQAVTLYRRLAQTVEVPHLKALFETMLREENAHVATWKRLIESCTEGLLPNLFVNPSQVSQDLAELGRRVQRLHDQFDILVQCNHPLLLALRLEFYLLHPAVMKLMHYMRGVDPVVSGFTAYESHLGHLLDAMQREPALVSSLDAELLSEAVRNVYQAFEMSVNAPLRDGLTGLLNRQGLRVAEAPLLHLARRNGDPVAFMLTDVDKLQWINETYGHTRGDEVLRQAALSLRTHLRQSDLVGRFGGDEFLAVLAPVEPASLEPIARKVQQQLAQESPLPVPVTVSIGVACGRLTDNPLDSGNNLLVAAERAMHAVLQRGRISIVDLC